MGAVAPPERLSPRCAQCGQEVGRGTGRKRLVCSSCSDVTYCSSDCQAQHWPSHRKDCQLAKFYIDRNETRALAQREPVALQRDFFSFVQGAHVHVFGIIGSLYRLGKMQTPTIRNERCPLIFRLFFSYDASAPVDELQRRFQLERINSVSRIAYWKHRQSSSDSAWREFLSEDDTARRMPPAGMPELDDEEEPRVEIALEWSVLARQEIVPRWHFLAVPKLSEPQWWETQPGAQRKLFNSLARRFAGNLEERS